MVAFVDTMIQLTIFACIITTKGNRIPWQPNQASFLAFLHQKFFKHISLSICTLLVAFIICLTPTVSSSTDDAAVPIHVIGHIRLEIPDDLHEAFRQITSAHFTETEEQERPNLYTCNRDINDPSLYVWNEE